MAKKTNPAVIGAFVAGALVLALAAVVVWGSPTLFERKYQYVCYFDGSVNGLVRGAPMKYRGVEVGVVKDIRVRYRQAPDDHRIPVFVESYGKRLRELGGEQEPTPETLRALIARGLRARLATQSLVTGVLYIGLDFAPGTPVRLSELPDGGMAEIPTLPTELEEATKSVTDVLANLKAADFKGMIESISGAADGVSDLTRTPALRTTLQELPGVVTAVHELAKTADKTVGRAGVVVEDAHEMVETARGTIAPHAPLSVDVAQTLSDVDKAAVAVRELADFLRRNPHAIVAGTKARRETQ